MPFPPSPRLVFEHNPLRTVTCQLRFPTILEIGAENPAVFQKAIREAYPEYALDDGGSSGLPAQVTKLLDQFQINLPGLGRPVHRFKDEAETTTVSLAVDFLAVETTDYTRWEQLRGEIVRAKTAFEKIYSPAPYSRIGLRYRNVIDMAELGVREPWDKLLHSSLIGLLTTGELGGEIKENRTQTLLAISDIEGGQLSLNHGLIRLEPDEREAYTIDADFTVSGKRTQHDHVLTILDAFRKIAGDLFRWAATDRLKGLLKPMDESH